MTDLTAITTPYGLLDPETQRALKEHGGPWEIFHVEGYWKTVVPLFSPGMVYRVTPPPPKPREWWVNEYKTRLTDDSVWFGPMKPTKEEAEADVVTYRIRCIRVREVIE